MPDATNSRRRTFMVALLGIATVAGITGLQIVDDAPSRAPLETSATTTTTSTKG